MELRALKWIDIDMAKEGNFLNVLVRDSINQIVLYKVIISLK